MGVPLPTKNKIRHLHVPDENVFAVEINWDSDGRFDSLNETNGFAVSKLDGAAKIQHRFADGIEEVAHTLIAYAFVL